MCNSNKRTPHKHADLIRAWADGAEIQHWWDDTWYTTMAPQWRVDQKYRIKPEQSDLEKYGVEVGDVWLCAETSKTQFIIVRVVGEHLSTRTIEGRGSMYYYELARVSLQHDTLLFRRGVVNKL